MKDRQGNEIKRAYVLAGGQSRRMGRGQDKLFLKLNGSTLLERTVTICREVFETVMISAKNPGKFDAIDCAVVSDWSGADGPLAGIVASLEDCGRGACFITAVDFCDLNAGIITSLVKKYNGEDYFGLQENNHLQPLCGIYSIAINKQLMEIAASGNYGMKDALKTCNTGSLPVSVEQWRNINTLSDLVTGGGND